MLLCYVDIFHICLITLIRLLFLGGDDVAQLCEAGEEEFLEIMSLVGMASKPLHVRRLQKSLQEWVTKPKMFKNLNVSIARVCGHASIFLFYFLT